MSITATTPVSTHAPAGYGTDATSRDGHGATDTLNAFSTYEAPTTASRKTAASDRIDLSSRCNEASRIGNYTLLLQGVPCRSLPRNIQPD